MDLNNNIKIFPYQHCLLGCPGPILYFKGLRSTLGLWGVAYIGYSPRTRQGTLLLDISGPYRYLQEMLNWGAPGHLWLSPQRLHCTALCPHSKSSSFPNPEFSTLPASILLYLPAEAFHPFLLITCYALSGSFRITFQKSTLSTVFYEYFITS